MNKDDDNYNEDDDLWGDFSRDIKKIDKNVAPNHGLSNILSRKYPKNKNLLLDEIYDSKITIPNSPNKSFCVNESTDYRKITRSIKKNKISVEARIDLHGMSQLEAHSVLLSFIKDSYMLKRKCVLIITGKGDRNYINRVGNKGVLKRMVPQWLDSPSISGMVKRHMDALPKDGGGGALYVFL